MWSEELGISRSEYAAQLFGQGYNCCQSVFLAFSDRYGLEEELALRLSCSLGAGMGRMRLVCGTVSAMALVCGLETGNTDPKDQEGKTRNYEEIRKLAGAFRDSQGTVICRELLGLSEEEAQAEGAAPARRTAEYYKKRPCKELVRRADQILE